MNRHLIATAATVLALAPALAACSDPADPEPPASDPTGAEPTDPAEPPPTDVAVTLTEVAAAEAPIAGVPGPDGALWIAERAGRVRILGDGELGEPLIDISDETTTDGERGLLGMAFDPAFEHFYLSYTDRNGNTAIDEVAVADGELRPATRRTILTQEQPYANHNGGDIAFGPDGMLYIGLGDGGSGGDPHGNGQNLGTLLGKLLRIDPAGGDPYGIPPDNPFVDDPDARPEIWAYGLRNPWRFSFDAETGDLWIADVGQSAREEVDRLPAGSGAGANFGWSAMEGRLEVNGEEPDDHVPPVFEYQTSERCSITGGYVYRGSAIPALAGSYLFSDYCEGGIRALNPDGDELDLGVNGGSVVAFAQDSDLELYVLDLQGAIYRLDPAG
ncbi:MAG TPA: PQQ-dependent sugar dehydrogenase [Natronosporangium sp.]